MSLKSIFKNKNVRKGGAATMIAGGVLAATLALAPGSGAVFTANGAGTANFNTAKLSLDFGQNKTGTFNVSFDNVAPGDRVFKTFQVNNTGTIPADVTFHVRDLTPTQGQIPADPSALSYHIEGYNPAKVVAGTGDPVIQLGTLGAGESRTYELYVELDRDKAGNEWQNIKAVSNLDVVLTQH